MGFRDHLLRRRWSTSIALALIAAVALVATVISRWTHDVLFDTDTWVATIGEAGTEPEVTDALADRVSTSVIDFLDAEDRLEALLPPVLQPLSPLVAARFENSIQEGAESFFASERYERAWLQINETAHRAAVAVIKDEVPAVSTADGIVTVDITPLVEPIVEGALDRLSTVGETIPEVLLNRTEVDESIAGVVTELEEQGLPDWMSAVEVFRSDQLAAVQTGASVLDSLVWVLPFLTILLVAGALYLAPDRTRMGGLLLFLAALGWAASLIGINSVIGSITGAFESPETANIAQRLMDGITGGLEALLVALIAAAGTGTVAVLGWALYRALRGGQPD